MFARVEVDAVSEAGGDDLLTIQVITFQGGGERLINPGKGAAAGVAVGDFGMEIRQMGEITDRGRRDEEEQRRGVVRSGITGEDDAGEDTRPGCDLGGRGVDDGLEIVRAKHHHDDVYGLVALQTGGEVEAAVAGDVERIFVHGHASVLAFLDDPIPGAEGGGE